jgi:DivIVA domain-containing protein
VSVVETDSSGHEILDAASGAARPVTMEPLDAGGISTRRFAQARRGYETSEVDAFLREVAEHVSRLEADSAHARSKVDGLSARAASSEEAAYDRIASDFAYVIRTADRAASEVRGSAEANARATVAAARAEADRVVAEAHEAAERVVAGAREEAARLRSDAESVRADAQGIRSEAESIRSQAQAAREDAEGLRGEAETMRAQASTMRAQAAAWRSQVLEEHRRLTQSRPTPAADASFDLPEVDFGGLTELLGGLTDES